MTGDMASMLKIIDHSMINMIWEVHSTQFSQEGRVPNSVKSLWLVDEKITDSQPIVLHAFSLKKSSSAPSQSSAFFEKTDILKK